jgi:hypothetical protein
MYLYTGLGRPRGFQAIETPGLLDNRHVKVARLSVLHTGRLYPQKIPWYSFLLEAEWTPGLLNTDRRIRSLKKMPITPSENEPATSCLVVQCLNQLMLLKER